MENDPIGTPPKSEDTLLSASLWAMVPRDTPSGENASIVRSPSNRGSLRTPILPNCPAVDRAYVTDNAGAVNVNRIVSPLSTILSLLPPTMPRPFKLSTLMFADPVTVYPIPDQRRCRRSSDIKKVDRFGDSRPRADKQRSGKWCSQLLDVSSREFLIERGLREPLVEMSRPRCKKLTQWLKAEG